MSIRIVKINRGDSFEFMIDSPELSSNDGVYFALMYPNQYIEDAIIYKGIYTQSDKITDGDDVGKIKIKLTPYDTKFLTPGVYYYTVKLQKGGSLADLGATEEPDEVITLVERTKFIINE